MRSIILAIALCSATMPLAAQDAANLVIGGEDAKGVELVNPVAMIAAGRRLIILESTAPHLRVLTSSGRLVQTLGRSGQGPGEFQRPIAVLYDSAAARVMVLDRLHVTYYNMLGDTLVFAATRRLPIVPSGACAFGGQLWIVRRNDKGLLHHVSPVGNELAVTRSIGAVQPVQPSGPANAQEMRSIMASGPVVCDPVRRTVFLVSRVFGEVRALPLIASQSRLYPLPGFINAEVKTGGEKGVQLDPPVSGEYDEAVGAIMTTLGPRVVVGRKTPAQTRPDDYASFRVFSLSGTNAGTAIATGRSRPIGDSPSGVFCYFQDPVPTIQRFPSGKCPAR